MSTNVLLMMRKLFVPKMLSRSSIFPGDSDGGSVVWPTGVSAGLFPGGSGAENWADEFERGPGAVARRNGHGVDGDEAEVSSESLTNGSVWKGRA